MDDSNWYITDIQTDYDMFKRFEEKVELNHGGCIKSLPIAMRIRVCG
jgi:hypothetical protein